MMIFRMLALFVIALAMNSILRRVFRSFPRPAPDRSRSRDARYAKKPGRGARRQPEPAEFEVLEEEKNA